MTRIFVSCLLFIVGFATSRSEIRWTGKEYNYGAFKEADGPRKGELSFVNCGTDTTFISGVRPSCGCTDVDYTQDMIAPGDTATVSFVYDPKGRPGSFNKTIKVFVGKEKSMHVLRLSGTVVGSAATLARNYPVENGVLRLESSGANAGELKEGSSRHIFINAYNQSEDTIRPSWHSGSHAVEVELTPRAIPPGEIATFGLYLRTTEEERMGPVEYSVAITADSAHPDKDTCHVTLNAVIVPDTAKLSVEEIENGPRAYLVPEFVDLGETGGRDRMDFAFEILNDGKSTLSVMRVYPADDNVEIKSRPSRIKPGKSGKVEGSIDLRQIPEGGFRQIVNVMTNDGLHPVRTMSLTGIRQ